MLVSVIEIEDPSEARVLITALKAHGFNPLETGEVGLPGMPGITGVDGKFMVRVPEEEAADAKLLAEVLVAEMRLEKP